MGGVVDCQDRRNTPGDSSQSWRLAAKRYFLRWPRAADRLGAAFIPGLLAACAQRAPALFDRARRIKAHGGIVLGSRGAGHAGANLTVRQRGDALGWIIRGHGGEL